MANTEELKRLWELKQAGALTAEEYLGLKANLLEGTGTSGSDDDTAAANESDAKIHDPANCRPTDHYAWGLTGERRPFTTKDKWVLGIVVGVLLVISLPVIAVMGNAGSKGSSNSTAVSSNPETADERDSLSGSTAPSSSGEAIGADAQSSGQASSWSYNTQIDQVRGKPIYEATTTSENEVQFAAPYDGGSNLELLVRKHPQWGQDVVFRISNGQFVCGVESCAGTINYGNGPERLSLRESADYDSKVLFVSNGPGVIRNLKSAKKVVVELPFYQEGNEQFTFNTAGLVWPPKEPKQRKLSPPDANGCVKELAKEAHLSC